MSAKNFKQGYGPIQKGLVIGLDVGIASCGWAVLNRDGQKIHSMGAHCFDPSEEPKTRELKNAKRRSMRGQRRVVRRRQQRMRLVREAIRNHGLLDDPSPAHFQKLKGAAPNPWHARAEGLTRQLTPVEAAAALIHIAKHRGFKSNSKTDQSDKAPSDSKKMLSAMEHTRKELKGRTFGQMMVEDRAHQPEGERQRRRNRDGEYRFTPKREDLVDEANRLLTRSKNSAHVGRAGVCEKRTWTRRSRRARCRAARIWWGRVRSRARKSARRSLVTRSSAFAFFKNLRT